MCVCVLIVFNCMLMCQFAIKFSTLLIEQGGKMMFQH